MDYTLTITNHTITSNVIQGYASEPEFPDFIPDDPGTVGSALKRIDWAGNWTRYRK